MGNLDFSLDPTFAWYVVLLIITGVAMVVIGALVAKTTASRLLNLLFGIGFVGYGIYLGWIFEGGTYVIFFKAFILPAVLIFQAVRESVRRRQAPAAPVEPAKVEAPQE